MSDSEKADKEVEEAMKRAFDVGNDEEIDVQNILRDRFNINDNHYRLTTVKEEEIEDDKEEESIEDSDEVEESLETKRLEAERLEKERLEAERLETERLEAERLEAERLQTERQVRFPLMT